MMEGVRMTWSSASVLWLSLSLVQATSPPSSTPPPSSSPAPAVTQGGGSFPGTPAAQPPSSPTQGPAAGGLPSTPTVRLGSSPAPAAPSPASGTGAGAGGSSSFRAAATPPAGPASTGSLPSSQSPGLPSSVAPSPATPTTTAPATSAPAAPTNSGFNPSSTSPSQTSPSQTSPTLPPPSANALPTGPLNPGFRPAPAAAPTTSPAPAASQSVPTTPATTANQSSGLPTARFAPSGSSSPSGQTQSSDPAPAFNPSLPPSSTPSTGTLASPSTSSAPTPTLQGLPPASSGFSGSPSTTPQYQPPQGTAPSAAPSGFVPTAPQNGPTLPPSTSRSTLPPSNSGFQDPSGREPTPSAGLPGRSFSGEAPSNTPRSLSTSGTGTRPATSPARQAPVEEPEPPIDPTASLAARGVVDRAMREFRSQIGSGDFPLPLVDAIPMSNEVAQRKLAIKRYWTLTIASIDLAHARSEASDLAAIPAPMDERQRASLQAAQAIARARQAEATLAFELAQQDLVDVLDPSLAIENPIPIEVPFIGRYRTRIAQFAQQATQFPEIETIDRSLPYLLQSMQARGDAIIALETEVNAISLQYRANPNSLDDLLRAHAALRDQRLAFLATVRDYNHSIAEYSLTVGPRFANPNEVITMLIKTPAESVARNPEFRRSAMSPDDRNPVGRR